MYQYSVKSALYAKLHSATTLQIRANLEVNDEKMIILMSDKIVYQYNL